jgi:Xaa-Pro aminopeptidase
MSKEFFHPSEFGARQVRVRRAMAEQDLDLLLVISPVNINYLVGAATKAYQVFQCLFFTAEPGPLTLLLRLPDVAEAIDFSLAQDVRGWDGRRWEDPVAVFDAILKEKGWRKSRIGFETPAYYLSVEDYRKLQAVLADAKVSDATHLVENLKLVKSPAEIEYIKKAAAIADIGIEAIGRNLAPGRSEREVAADAQYAMTIAGGDNPASPMNFMSGERTGYAHGQPSDRVLRQGDFVHVQFGGQYRRYCSTIGRHYSLGMASAHAREIHKVTSEACDACVAAIKAGVPAAYPHQVATDVIRKAGFSEFNLHKTGYGIAPGFPPAWGESLTVFDQSSYTLEAGMVVSVEPPIFIHSENIGARLIDCVIVRANGAEVLSRHSRDLIIT